MRVLLTMSCNNIVLNIILTLYEGYMISVHIMVMENLLRRFFMDPRVSREGLGVTIERGKPNKTRR